MLGFSCVVLDSNIVVLWISVHLCGPFIPFISGVPQLGKAFLRIIGEGIPVSLWVFLSLGPEF